MGRFSRRVANRLPLRRNFIAAQLPNRDIDSNRRPAQPPADTLWAKNGNYEYCYQFSDREIWLNLPSSTNSKRHKVPNRHVLGACYIQSQSIGLKYFTDDMILPKQQYSYLPFFAHRVYSRIVFLRLQSTSRPPKPIQQQLPTF